MDYYFAQYHLIKISKNKQKINKKLLLHFFKVFSLKIQAAFANKSKLSKIKNKETIFFL